jgi:hypothetical protein
MNNWYEIISAIEPLTQGDFIFDCPVPTWKDENLEITGNDEADVLKASQDFFSADVIVMTQACDLEHNKVKNVTLCPHISLSEYKKDWKIYQEARNQSTKDETWRKQCETLKKGYVWNMILLNNSEMLEMPFEHRIVDFYHIYTVPKVFLENLLKKRGKLRPRLLPPYREHLSQFFARFYMRVGLPTEINKGW